MALNVTCCNSHSYIQADIYSDWPIGAPHCPICFEDWKIVNGHSRQVLYMSHIAREYVRNYPDCIFLFGDNLKGRGYGGQAAEIRGEPNAIGIPTKRYPAMEEGACFKPEDFDTIKPIVDRIFESIPKDKTVVIPTSGIGTGLAMLPEKCPALYEYIKQKISELE